MRKVHCVILDKDQMPRAKAVLKDIQGKNAYLDLIQNSYDHYDFDERETIKLRFINMDNQPETYRGRVASIDGKAMELAHFEMLEQPDMREDVKVLVKKPIIMVHTDPQTGQMYKHSAHLRDLSAGGLCIYSSADVPRFGDFEIVFNLDPARKPDVLRVQVIRKSKMDDGRFSYGCKFMDLYFTQEHMVREYVFKRHLGLIGPLRRSLDEELTAEGAPS